MPVAKGSVTGMRVRIICYAPLGEWCCVWALHGEPLSRKEEITGINLTEEPDGSIGGTFSWGKRRIPSRM